MSKIGKGVGKRKKSVARATLKKGSGKIRINKKPIRQFDRYKNLRLKESLLFVDENKFNIDVNVSGGGAWSQIDAARTAIANAIVDWTEDEKIRQKYIDYDRSIIVSDSRRTEPHKPSRSGAGARRTKQQSKR